MRCIKINKVTFYNYEVENDLTNLYPPLMLNFDDSEVDYNESDGSDEMTDFVCEELRYLFGYNDVDFVDFDEVETFYSGLQPLH